MAEYISRDELDDFIYCNKPCKSDYYGIGIAEEMKLDAIKELCDELDKLPFVEIEEEQIKRGHWEYDFIAPNGADSVKVTARCSECGCTSSISWWDGMGNLSDGNGTQVVWSGFFTNFHGSEETVKDYSLNAARRMKMFKHCPNCGAKMDEEE